MALTIIRFQNFIEFAIKQLHLVLLRFLDDRIFATCSDDCSVCIWDLRNLKSRVHQLSGHKSWVKNIEYSRRDNLIVTSGLDGSIYTWDVNGGEESRYQKVFHTPGNYSSGDGKWISIIRRSLIPGLMRCRISNDDSKMVICTTGGYLIIVNDLNLSTLAADLKGFRPNLHRLMQLGDQYFPIVSEFRHVFDTRRRRNRIELVSDFPENNEAEVICSLAIHPHNWVAISRNMNADEQSEWTCVHDVQEMADPYQHQQPRSKHSAGTSRSAFVDQEDEYDAVKQRVAVQFASLRQQVLDQMKKSTTAEHKTRAKNALKKVNRFLTLLGDPLDSNTTLPIVPNTSFDMWSGQLAEHRANNRTGVSRLCSGLITAKVVRTNNNTDEVDITEADPGIYLTSSDDDDDDVGVEDADHQNDEEPLVDKFYTTIGKRLNKLIEELRAVQHHMNQKYKTNKPRLLYYSRELNAGKGFIKELCFSSDGRVIASPYGKGVRLLAFNNKCQELSDCVESWNGPQAPQVLQEIVVDKECHSNVVVCAKFSPNYPLLVTGCLRGSIVWHNPRL